MNMRAASVAGVTGGIGSAFRWIVDGRGVSLKITGVYLLVGTAWALYFCTLITAPPEKIKDLSFVLVTGALLYWLIDRGVTALRRSQDALWESQERLSGILETNPCGVLLIDRGGRVEYANLAAATIFGVARGELVGQDYGAAGWGITTAEGDPFPEDDRLRNRVLLLGESVYDNECAVRRPGRERVVLSYNSAPLRDAKGAITGMMLAFIDITERKKAQELMLRKLFLAVEQSPIAIMITDTASVVEYVNPRFTEMTGYAAEEVIGSKKTSLCAESDEKCAAVCEGIRIEGEWREETRNMRKNGDIYWESVSVTPIRDPDGAITHYLWIREDVTERRTADEALRESEERSRQLFEQAEEPAMLFSAGSAVILDVNPAAAALYGYSRQELIGNGPGLFADAGADADGAALERGLPRIGEKEGLVLDRVRHRRKDGTGIIVSVRGQSIRLKGGRVSYCTFRDITERVRLEEEAKKQHAQLIHSNRIAALGTITSGVAHDINNPNNLIMFNVPILSAAWQDVAPILDEYRRENGDFSLGGLSFSEMRDTVPKLLGGIAEASLRIKNIVGVLKDFARQDGARHECAIAVNEVVKKAVALLNHEIMKGTRRFDLALEPGLPLVKGCATQLEQVVINLIINALQALPDKAFGVRVSTGIDPASGGAEIRVEDEGVGMSPDVLGRITQPFFSTKQGAGGLGLGLSISQSIVNEHRGTLTFRSEVGKGTTARVALPAMADGYPAAPRHIAPLRAMG